MRSWAPHFGPRAPGMSPPRAGVAWERSHRWSYCIEEVQGCKAPGMPRKHRWTRAGQAAAAARRVPDGDCVGDCRVAGTTLDRPCPGRCVQLLLGVTARWRRGRRSRRGSRYTSTVVRVAHQVAPGFDGGRERCRPGPGGVADPERLPVATGVAGCGPAADRPRPTPAAALPSATSPRRPPCAGLARGGARRCRRPAPARRPIPTRAGAVLVGPVIETVVDPVGAGGPAPVPAADPAPVDRGRRSTARGTGCRDERISPQRCFDLSSIPAEKIYRALFLHFRALGHRVWQCVAAG